MERMKRLPSTKIETSCVCRELASRVNERSNLDVGSSYFEEEMRLRL